MRSWVVKTTVEYLRLPRLVGRRDVLTEKFLILYFSDPLRTRHKELTPASTTPPGTKETSSRGHPVCNFSKDEACNEVGNAEVKRVQPVLILFFWLWEILSTNWCDTENLIHRYRHVLVARTDTHTPSNYEPLGREAPSLEDLFQV